MSVFELVLRFILNDFCRLPANTPFHSISVVAAQLRIQHLGQTHIRQLDLQEAVDEDVVRFDVSMHYVVLMQELCSFKDFLHDAAYELRIADLPVAFEQFGYLKHWLSYISLMALANLMNIDATSGVVELHKLDEVFQVSFTLLNGKVNEVVILLLVEVGQQILVNVYLLKQLNLLLSHLLVLTKHPFNSNLATMESTLKDACAATPLAKQFVLVNLDE